MKEGPGNSGPLVYIFKAEEEMCILLCFYIYQKFV